MIAFVKNSALSGTIRGTDIAKKINRCLNPPIDQWNNYRIIFVKILPDKCPTDCYCDLQDMLPHTIIPLLKPFPNMNIIAMTKLSVDWYYKIYGDKKHIIYIPQHHCNHNRIQRISRDVRVVGYLGSAINLIDSPQEWKERFASVDLEFHYQRVRIGSKITPKDAVEFYKTIDIQLHMRPSTWRRGTAPRFKDSSKLVNAGSFGIPTVGFEERHASIELPGCTVIANTVEDALKQCCRLRDEKSYYEDISQLVRKRSEEWNIDYIAPLYLQLEAV